MGPMRYGSLINQTSLNGRQTVMLCRDILNYKEDALRQVTERCFVEGTEVLSWPHREVFLSQGSFHDDPLRLEIHVIGQQFSEF